MTMTNREVLALTIEQALATYANENDGFWENESTWGFIVLEPLLSALGWNRLPRNERALTAGTGAFFEWPKKHAADVVLLDSGNPVAFGELKGSKRTAYPDLDRRLEKLPRLLECRVAFAGWYKQGGGLAICDVSGSTTAQRGKDVPIAVSESALSGVAQIAREVLTEDVTPGDWLDSVTPLPGPVHPRFSQRKMQQYFFERLYAEFNVVASVRSRLRAVGKPGTAKLCFAHVDLPGVPEGCGLTLDMDVCVNRLQCFLYDRSVRKLPKPVLRISFDEVLTPDQIDAFIVNQVREAVIQHQKRCR